MENRHDDASPPSFESAFDSAASGLADGLASDIEHVLGDPIVRLLMAADRIERPHLLSILGRAARRLRNGLPEERKELQGTAAPYPL